MDYAPDDNPFIAGCLIADSHRNDAVEWILGSYSIIFAEKQSMQKLKSTLVVADTQFLINFSIKALVEVSSDYHLLGIAENYQALKGMLSSEKIHVLITDVLLFDYDSFKSLENIKSEYPDLNILILTNNLNKNELNELLRIGIKSIVYKTADSDEFFQAIDATLKKKKFYCSEVLDMIMESSTKNGLSESSHLTPAEIEVVKLISGGLTTKEIAEKKHVSFHTIMSHRKNIFRKLKINNVSELLMYALRVGVIEDNTEYFI
jgi:DNA-binding NarL/FixJ family response regulator